LEHRLRKTGYPLQIARMRSKRPHRFPRCSEQEYFPTARWSNKRAARISVEDRARRPEFRRTSQNRRLKINDGDVFDRPISRWPDALLHSASLSSIPIFDNR
jgi:hypothetical protein